MNILGKTNFAKSHFYLSKYARWKHRSQMCQWWHANMNARWKHRIQMCQWCTHKYEHLRENSTFESIMSKSHFYLSKYTSCDYHTTLMMTAYFISWEKLNPTASVDAELFHMPISLVGNTKTASRQKIYGQQVVVVLPWTSHPWTEQIP